MPRTLPIFIRRQQYTVIRSPDALYDARNRRCMALPDHEQHVVWIDPGVTPVEVPALLHDVARHLYRHVPAASA